MHMTFTRRIALVPCLCAISLAGCESSQTLVTLPSQNAPLPEASASPRQISHPGSAPWQQVPRDRIAKECGLDPDLLDAAEEAGLDNSPHAIVRYGKLCWTGGGDAETLDEVYEINSSTKTLGALVFGIVAARTDVDENVYARDWLELGEINSDVPGTVISLPPLNPDARIFHMLTQTGHNPVLRYGMRVPWTYDAVGIRGMNALVPLMNNVIEAYPEAFPGSTSAREVAVNELFAPLGMNSTEWAGVIVAGGARSTIFDMAKLGLLMLRKGRWGDEQIIDEDYVYRLSHPQIEDVHTGYGYLTWLNADLGVANLFDFKVDRECSPFARWQRYPHPPTFEAPDDNGGSPFEPQYDIGTFWADGAGGQMLYVHRGLDLVLVIRDDEAAQENDPESQRRGESNATGLEFHRLWRYVRPALVAMDPIYKGDEAAFCDAYRRGAYAPDLVSPWNPDSGFGSSRIDAR